MNSQRRLLTFGAIGALCWSLVVASPQPANAGPESIESVKKEYEDAIKAWSADRRAAYDEFQKKGIGATFKFDKPAPAALFSPRFLAIAEQNPDSPAAIEALKWALQTSAGPRPDQPLATRARAIKILHDQYVTKPQIKALLRVVAQYDDDDANKLVADVIAHNPDREIQAAAYKSQISYLETVAQFVENVKDPRRIGMIERSQGKDYVKKRLARAETAKAELEILTKTLREKYSDVFPDLSIGQPMPALASEGLDGKTVSSADLKGKVVVFDIWATWCGPCRAMIPHEREMVERLKDKPFALVSVSFDADKKTLVDFLAKEKMPWTHWWNGAEGKLMDLLNIEHFPTIFVVDPKGVIRYKEIRGEELEKAVDKLLDEIKTGATHAA